MTDKFLTKEERDEIITNSIGIIMKTVVGNMIRHIISKESMTPDLLKKIRIKVKRINNIIDGATEKLNTCRAECGINSIGYQNRLDELLWKIIDEYGRILDEIEGKRS
jgi:division protein CdvB (Snf7/Vps24/ESCRT-III family)